VGIPREALVIGFVADSVRAKVIGTLIAGSLNSQKARLVIVGTGPVGSCRCAGFAEKLGVTGPLVWAGFRMTFTG